MLDIRKNIAPENSEDRKGARYRSADTQRATPKIRCLDAERISQIALWQSQLSTRGYLEDMVIEVLYDSCL